MKERGVGRAGSLGLLRSYQVGRGPASMRTDNPWQGPKGVVSKAKNWDVDVHRPKKTVLGVLSIFCRAQACSDGADEPETHLTCPHSQQRHRETSDRSVSASSRATGENSQLSTPQPAPFYVSGSQCLAQEKGAFIIRCKMKSLNWVNLQ